MHLKGGTIAHQILLVLQASYFGAGVTVLAEKIPTDKATLRVELRRCTLNGFIQKIPIQGSPLNDEERFNYKINARGQQELIEISDNQPIKDYEDFFGSQVPDVAQVIATVPNSVWALAGNFNN